MRQINDCIDTHEGGSEKGSKKGKEEAVVGGVAVKGAAVPALKPKLK